MLDDLRCENDVHRLIFDGKAQRISNKVRRSVDSSMIHSKMLSGRKEITIGLVSTANVEDFRALAADQLQGSPRGPLQIRPKVSIV